MSIEQTYTPKNKTTPLLDDDDENNITNHNLKMELSSPPLPNILNRTIENCASDVLGILGVEVWKYCPLGGSLIPQTKNVVVVDLPHSVEAYEALMSQECQNTPAGVGLVGTLWSESNNAAVRENGGGKPAVVWRNVEGMANDPDKPLDERIQNLVKAGFTLAAGVAFESRGYQGIVVYYGNPHIASYEDPANLESLECAAALIGAAAAANTTLQKTAATRSATMTKKMLSQEKIEDAKASVSIESAANQQMGCCDTVKAKVGRWAKKARGGNTPIPPVVSWTQCGWMLLGVLLTNIVLSYANWYISDATNEEIQLLLAPLGALSAIHFSLTPAPAAQPRNTFFSQVLALPIALGVSRIPATVMPTWLRPVLAMCIVIPGLAKIGLVHPPAGAVAAVYSKGGHTFWDIPVFLAAISFNIFMSVAINNLSDKRQYPTNWPIINWIKAKLYSSKTNKD